MPNWKDPVIQKRFLLAVMKECELKPSGKAANIAAYFDDCTPKAVTHQLAALNKEIAALETDMPATADGEDGAAPTPKPARKRAAPKTDAKDKPAKKLKTDTKKAKKSAAKVDSDAELSAGEDAEEEEKPVDKPAKKPKKESKKKPAVKKESDDGITPSPPPPEDVE